LGADHDYDGHRVKAMVAIAEACRLMGTDIVPPGLAERLEAAGSGTRPATKPVAKPATKPAAKPASKPATKPATRPAAGERHPTPEPEPQALSDQQLQQARTIVQQVRNSIPAGKQPRVVEHLDKAVTEIGTALTIK
jgi:hypothetical protein